MASLKYGANSSLQTVTLGSNYTAADGSMSLTSGHGARLPSSGDFWLAHDNGSGTVRIFKVTARATDTLTVTPDATEGNGDGNIASGQTLRWALTVAALDQMRADQCGYGTYANLPATCKIGDRYVTSDSIYEFVATATNTWQALYQGKAVTIPVSGDFAWINQGSATVVSAAGSVVLYAPLSASDNIRIRKKTAPATPYTIEAAFIPVGQAANFSGAGVGWRESSSGKLINFGLVYSTGWHTLLAKWDSVTAFNANYTLSPSPTGPFPIYWVRFTDNGTNRIVEFSTNGSDWTTLNTTGRTDFITADEITFYANSNNSAPVYLTLVHWKQS